MTWKVKMFKLKEDGKIGRTLTKKEVLELIREYSKFCNADFLKTDHDKLVYYLQELYSSWYISLGIKKHNLGFGMVENTEEVMYVDSEIDANYGVVFITREGCFKGSTAWGDIILDRITNNISQAEELIL